MSDELEEEFGARRDGVRGRDDVHRPDHCRDRDTEDSAGAVVVRDGRAVGHQRIPARAFRAIRNRREAGRRARSSADGRDRRDRFRGYVSVLWLYAERERGSGVDHRLSNPSGRQRGIAIPGRGGNRGLGVPAARTGARDGDFLRDRRRAHRDRADRRRLPDAMDLALDLLDQRTGRDRRAAADSQELRGDKGRAHQARLPRHGSDQRRDGPTRARL